MDPKDGFEQGARRSRRGLFDSAEEASAARLPLGIPDEIPRVIEFRRKAESWFSFPYHCLMNLEYEPHERIILGFSTHRVEIRGRNLTTLYKEIKTQSCGQVEETGRAMALAANEDAPEVAVIAVHELECGHDVGDVAAEV